MVPRFAARPTALPHLRALCHWAASVERGTAAIASRFCLPCNKGCGLVDARTRPAESVLRSSHEGSAFRAATAITPGGFEMSIAPQYTYRQLASDDVTLLK